MDKNNRGEGEGRDNLLDHARLQWLVGNWKEIADISIDDRSYFSRWPELTLLLAIALAQVSRVSEAKNLIIQAQHDGASKKDAFRIFVGGVHNSLARANLLRNEYSCARKHFSRALDPFAAEKEIPEIIRGRTRGQLAQLGLPMGLAELLDSSDNASAPLGVQLLNQATLVSPRDPSILIALAEAWQMAGDYGKAVLSWQKVVALMQERTPQVYYERFLESTKKMGRFPLGGDDEEKLAGVVDKHEYIAGLHQALKPALYLEIGVESGVSLSLAKCKAIGVDPMPRIRHKIPDSTEVVKATSDVFFETRANECLMSGVDLSFIDGMHLFEYALRDFINVEKYSKASSVAIMDDILPCHPAQAERLRRTRAWTGDVWKVYFILKSYRPDLDIELVDAFPTGLMLIKNLNSSSSVLEDNYQIIIDKYMHKDVPAAVVGRDFSSLAAMSI